ncbi:hypothetical protein C3F09_02250 [candidate division GN15 bacterium]|uniref:Lipoprotein n=1 Tax=candidate division GN15 bacterium TaxID=2072418 RepID=A0A855X6B7_9BACT|nr:MAG: hypothetical protein C3F09_02250 [candidate division GN15 bacterium]
MLRKLLIFVVLCAVVGLSGCEKAKEKQSDAPAGHPDELKDSTRLDPAPEQKDGERSGPQ